MVTQKSHYVAWYVNCWHFFLGFGIQLSRSNDTLYIAEVIESPIEKRKTNDQANECEWMSAYDNVFMMGDHDAIIE